MFPLELLPPPPSTAPPPPLPLPLPPLASGTAARGVELAALAVELAVAVELDDDTARVVSPAESMVMLSLPLSPRGLYAATTTRTGGVLCLSAVAVAAIDSAACPNDSMTAGRTHRIAASAKAFCSTVSVTKSTSLVARASEWVSRRVRQ